MIFQKNNNQHELAPSPPPPSANKKRKYLDEKYILNIRIIRYIFNSGGNVYELTLLCPNPIILTFISSFLIMNRIVLRNISIVTNFLQLVAHMLLLALPLHVAYLIQILEHCNLKIHLCC